MSESKPGIVQNTENTSNSKQGSEKAVATSSENVSQGLSLQAKKQLKQQGKQLLLKGCYRMAANKYTKIIDSGISQLIPRQQAIIYLNNGICYQFMSENNKQNYIKALEYMRKALLADYSYEKTYYRLIQLLRDNGHLEEVLTLVPSNIYNKEIDQLLKEVRQQYMNESDFKNIIDKFRNQALSISNGKALCSRLSTSIGKVLNKNVDFMSQIRNANFRTQVFEVGKEIESVYQLIGINDIDDKKQASTQNTEVRSSLMDCFKSVVEFTCMCSEDDKAKVATVDLILEPMFKLYRGQLSKFLNREFTFNNPQLKLAKESKLSSSNQFVTLTKRNVFFKSEYELLKYAKLVEANLQLFGRAYCHLSNKYYQMQRARITQEVTCKETSDYSDRLLSMFIYRNGLSSQEVIFSGLHFSNAKIESNQFFGAKSVYLYKNLEIVDLNFIKLIVEEECSKLGAVYSCVQIDPVWLGCLQHLVYYLDRLVDILLALVQVYSCRQAKNAKSLVNELNTVSELSHLVYIYHWQAKAYNQRTQADDKITDSIDEPMPYTQNFNYKFEHLLNYFEKQHQNFIALFLIQKIIQFTQQHSIKPASSPKTNQHQNKPPEPISDFNHHKQRTIQICIKKTKTLQNKIHHLSKNPNPQPYVYKEMYLILICIILKLDIKRKIDIDSSIIFKEVFKDVVSEMAIEVLLLILINTPTELHKYLENQKEITNLVQSFMSKPLLDQLQPFKILLNLIYIMVCDFEHDQQVFFAQKLGVSQQEVHNVRKLQKESMDEKQKQKLTKLKKKFRGYIAGEWHQIIGKMCKMVRVTLKMQGECSSKLCKVIETIAQSNHSKLYSGQIIEFMLQARGRKVGKNQFQRETKQTACRFFQKICKKCNVQIFEYKHIQGIADSLLWLISNCEHELTYFQSLLGLVNLSTTAVRIPIEQIEKCLYEENSYIMHAGVCVMNNILIYSDELQEDNEKNTKIKNRISELVYKYIEFYRDQIVNLQIQLPDTDYSHPKKIYNSLMSLATVLKLGKLQELESWVHAVKYIKTLSGNDASELMFKLAIYHSMEKSLPINWNQNLEQEMLNLKNLDLPKYLKLSQLI